MRGLRPTASNTVSPQDRVKTVLATMLGNVLRERADESVDSANLGKLVDELTNTAQDMLPRCRADLEPLKETLKDLKFDSYKEFAQRYAKDVSQIFLAHYSPRELEVTLRAFMEAGLDTPKHFVNDILHYDTFGDELCLHVLLSFTLSTSETATLILSGFRAVADRLRTDELKSINTVSAESFFVFDREKWFSKFGWTITKSDKIKQSARAEIPSAKFVEKYGTKQK